MIALQVALGIIIGFTVLKYSDRIFSGFKKLLSVLVPIFYLISFFIIVAVFGDWALDKVKPFYHENRTDFIRWITIASCILGFALVNVISKSEPAKQLDKKISNINQTLIRHNIPSIFYKLCWLTMPFLFFLMVLDCFLIKSQDLNLFVACTIMALLNIPLLILSNARRKLENRVEVQSDVIT